MAQSTDRQTAPRAGLAPPPASAPGVLFGFAWANLRFLFSRAARLRGAHRLLASRDVPASFFGICVASNPDPACDDYVIQALRDLGIRHVRLDYTYASEGSHTERFLKRLLDDGFRVMLRLVQPLDEARAMAAPAVREAWRDFVARTLRNHGARLELVELGATCNRRKWCGYSPATFLDAWRIAAAVARDHAVPVAAPNVTDFEPVYNIGFLALAARYGILPDVHTDNLFAERATEPEAYDRKILGRRLAAVAKVNTVKKAVLLQRITRHYRVPALMCTHVAWSERRIRRRLPDPRGKQADYLQRYLLLMAAVPAFERVYWGPLIGQREGPIDDGGQAYPELPHVTLYERAPGNVADYRRRPAFAALRTVVTMLSGARFVCDHARSTRLHVLEFAPAARQADATRRECLHVVWTTDGNGFDPATWYTPDALTRARATDRDGEAIPGFPTIIGESPVFLHWDEPPACRADRPTALRRHRFFATAGCTYRHVRTGNFEGIVATYTDHPAACAAAALSPEALERAPDRTVMRDKRNTVWRCRIGGVNGVDAVVKRSRIRSPLRRLLDRFKPSRPLRSWSASCELLRLGIATPRPIAYFQAADAPHAHDGYFVCEAFPGSGSVRKAFYDFARGATEYAGVPKDTIYRALADFLRVMHHRGCFFRDLSAGNVLIDVGADGVPRFALIDTTRARFFPRPASSAQRVSDLKRICHRLTWHERRAFLAHYFTDRRATPVLRIRLAFGLYDLKHALKQRLKRERKP